MSDEVIKTPEEIEAERIAAEEQAEKDRIAAEEEENASLSEVKPDPEADTRAHKEARLADIRGRLSAGELPAPERTALEKEMAELDAEIRGPQA